MILLLADLRRQFFIIFLPFSFFNHSNCYLQVTKKKTRQDKTKDHTLPNRNALARVLFLLVAF